MMCPVKYRRSRLGLQSVLGFLWTEMSQCGSLAFSIRLLHKPCEVLIHCTRGDNRSPAVAAAALAAFFGALASSG